MKISSEDLKEKWRAFKTQEGMLQRLDPMHPMDFFVGINRNGNNELVLITTTEPIQLKSSDSFEVEKNIRKDGRWATQITLTKKENEDIFSRFCLELVEVSAAAKNEKEGLDSIVRRFVAWQRLFANHSNDLSVNVIKGLIGELIFLRKASKHYGWETLLTAWTGPEGADRDFVFKEKWYEIKAISTGKDKVTISSLNQLESSSPGNLLIFRVDETVATDADARSIVGLIDDVRQDIIDNPVLVQRFDEKLISLGYIKKKSYETIYFSVGELNCYRVDNTFPRLVTNDVPPEVVSVKYELSIPGLDGWKVNEETLWNYQTIEKTI